MTENVRAILILEILGRPAEHVKEILSKIIEKLGKEKNVRLLNKTIAEPKEIEGQENIFTSFAEVEIETNLQTLMLLIFAYMPSHIDIITPEDLRIKNSDMNLFLNELVRKLHRYDELAKTLMMERQIIAKQIQEGKLKIERSERKKRIKKEESGGKKKTKKRKK